MIKLSSTMVIDFIGCWIIEIVCKYLFADLAPKAIVLRGRERRETRRREQEKVELEAAMKAVAADMASGNGSAEEKKQ